MATNLMTAYVEIVPSLQGFHAPIERAFGQVSNQASRAGRSAGSVMSSAIGKAAKTGAAAAGAAVTAAVGTALTKGFQRLTAIDDAEGKLKSLGNSAAVTGQAMDSAMASVKGTSYGLGEAATLAATAMAAGVKPGKDLTEYLSLAADAATIAGVGLNEMGSIFGKVQTQQRAYTMEINMLADRGIPIYQYLQEEMGVTQEQLRKMVAAGEVDSATYFRALKNNLGGAATAATTVSSQWSNTMAAMGRLGAAALEPFFHRLPGALGGVIAGIDKLTPKVGELAKAFDAKIFNEWVPKIRDMVAAFSSTGALDDIKLAFASMGDAAKDLVAPVATIVSSLGQASAALGVGAWQVWVASLNAAAGVLKAVEPPLRMIGDLMKAQPGLVTTAVLAWLAFKTVPGMLTRVSTAVMPMTNALTSAATGTRSLATGIGGLARANNQLIATSRTSFVEMGRFGSAVAQVGNRVPAVASMQGAFVGAAQGAQRFGRTAGTFAAMKSGISSVGTAAGGLVGALGGPLNLAIMGVTVFAGALFSSMQRSAAEMKAVEDASKRLADSQIELRDAFRDSNGAIDDNVTTVAASRIDQYRESVDAAAKADAKWHDVMYSGIFSALGLEAGGYADKLDDAAGAAQNTQKVLDDLGMSTKELSSKVYGSERDWNILSTSLIQSGEAGVVARNGLMKLRSEYMDQKITAERSVDGFEQMRDAMEVLGDESVTAADKLSALKTAMNALNPSRSEAEAMSQWGESIRSAASAAESGIDVSAFDASGELDVTTEAGKRLKDALVGIADSTAEAATNGGDMAKVAKGNEEAFENLAAAAGKSVDEIKEIYGTLGGDAVDIAVSLSGAGQTVQELGALKAAMDANPDEKTIEIDAEGTEAVQAALKQLGIDVQKAPDGKTIEIKASGDARERLQEVVDVAAKVPKGKPVNVTAPGGEAVYDLLHAMGIEVSTNNKKDILVESPTSPAVLDLLRQIGLEVINRNGKNIIVAAEDSDYQNKKRDWTATEHKQISVAAVLTEGMNYMGPGSPIGGSVPGRASGAIVPYVDGGISMLEAYANGGLKVIDKPKRADLFAGRGAGTIFAEEETGGEAFIPLAQSKRRRSTDILAVVADMFGMQLVPKDGSISGWLGGLAGTAVSKLLQKAGADGITRFASGGFNGKQLRELAEGRWGASQPLTGAPYVWGGTNWGDCSGAMSAFTRAAAGFQPFSGRWATGNAAAALTAMGFTRGRWQPGMMGVGIVNGGPGGGHTAGTLPDGTNVEMGGSYGGGKLGGTVGANDGQFTEQWVLPVPDYLPPVQPSALLPAVLGVDDSQQVPGVDPTVYTGAGASTASAPGAGDNSISGRFGAAANAAVSGQVADLLETLGINDSPGILAGLSEFEKTQEQRNGQDSSSGGAGKLDPDDEARRKEEFDDEWLDKQRALEDKITDLEHDYNERIAATKDAAQKRHLREELAEKKRALKREFEDAKRAAKRDYDQAKRDRAAAAKNAPAPATMSAYGDGTAPVGAVQDPDAPPAVSWNPGDGAEPWRPLMEWGIRRVGQGLTTAVAQVTAGVKQIDTESKGDPGVAQQHADANGSGEGAGVGLLQIIPSTWKAFRDPSLPDDRRNPAANIVGALRYYVDRYGADLTTNWGLGRGYKLGGFTGNGGVDDVAGVVHGREFVVNARATEQWRPELEAINAGRLPAAADVATADLGPRIQRNTYATFRDEAEYYRREQQAERLAAARIH